eukprot:gnl/Spiro4/28061_TR13896_c0_g1_i1.p1 gnl/Spiro4/28061_TR13896_c0_g1~~gnl/Spiro4/28061_TR13896_c0_g1_i1.p1  ORF type:complete len:386 (+),score=84.23 gnl/Spiro4/28061_TR13896_c0_g1_i1:109-1266(+)
MNCWRVFLILFVLHATAHRRRSDHESGTEISEESLKEVEVSKEPEISKESLKEVSKESVISEEECPQNHVEEHLIPRRTFLYVERMPGYFDENGKLHSLIYGFFKRSFSRKWYIQKYGGSTTTDSDFCAVLFPLNYITPKLMERCQRPCFATLLAAEMEIPQLGHWSFPTTPEAIKEPENDGEIEEGPSYFYKNPNVECLNFDKVAAQMKELYTSPERAVTALQLSELSCTMAVFDMAYYAFRTKQTKKSSPENWTGRENVGGSSFYGGRTEEQVLDDFKEYDIHPVKLGNDKLKYTLTFQDAKTIQQHIDKYGPCIGGLQLQGHAIIIDGFYFTKKGSPSAMFVRDPMHGLAYAIPWKRASTFVHFSCLFMAEKEQEKEKDSNL